MKVLTRSVDSFKYLRYDFKKKSSMKSFNCNCLQFKHRSIIVENTLQTVCSSQNISHHSVSRCT